MACAGCRQQAGLNTFISLVVPTINNDFGAATVVSGVIPEKTVFVVGDWNGEYTLLGTHDGVNFSPLAKFINSGGVQVNRSTQFKGSFLSLQIFRKAFGDTPPTITVASRATCPCAP